MSVAVAMMMAAVVMRPGMSVAAEMRSVRTRVALMRLASVRLAPVRLA